MRVENLYATTGFVSRAFFHIVGGQWLGKTSPRPTPTHLLVARASVHEDGGRNHDAPHLPHDGVMENMVGHGHTGADEAFLPVRANVTRGPADSNAITKTVVVVTVKRMIITRQSTRDLTRKSRGTSGAMVLQRHH